VANEARQGYVLLAEKTAADALANELQRQLQAADGAKQSLLEQITKDTAEDAQRRKTVNRGYSNMRCGFPKRTAVTLSIVAILTQSCAALEKRLNEAAMTQGKAQAGAVLPDWPDDCRKSEAHTALTEGA
jgi:hypothetical protein